MPIEIILALACLGCCTGFLAGLLGIGGGMVLTPFLTMLLAMASIPDQHIVHVAIATSMGTILFTSLSSVRAHAKRGAVLWNVVWAMAPGILVGGLIGPQISGSLPTFWIALFFACFVYFSAIKMFINTQPKPSRHLPGTAGMFGAGTVIGVISALVGAGGGFISVPFMTWCNVKMHNAVGTSSAFGFPIAFAGTIGYIWKGWGLETLPGWPFTLGYIHVPALLCVAVTSIFFAPLGAKVAHSIDTKPLKRIFACLLFVLASYMLWKALTSI
ncbi:sulfite exporter TauE/SafE family protein [Sutterella sp.]|uniref:sulfite exporter TauE/SafE family protein n=1 Tax=Sutterella sp. TaxID=1981025 RepID=UPI0026E0E3A4|nr:sulfite exporter TauE/SafE family protein [Sutterella sp.]MDO5532522.1 sulfite exporter TauE/SafE family protein [Sutterella sp.]